jgi:hypothetical protein
MKNQLVELKSFIETQIKNYQKVNYIEIEFGKKISDNIFKTIYCDNNECEFAKLIKHFRNYQLSYSQGKMYKYLENSLKTFNNKYKLIQKSSLLEKTTLNYLKYDMNVQNINKENLEEFPLNKNYNEDLEYDEVNIHISKDSNDQLLIFQKRGDYNILKMELKIDINLPYTFLETLMTDIEKILIILEENGFSMV